MVTLKGEINRLYEQTIHNAMHVICLTINSSLVVASGEGLSNPVPARYVLIKMLVRNMNACKQVCQQFAGKFDRMIVSHCSKDNSFMNLVRDLTGVNYLSSPVFILA